MIQNAKKSASVIIDVEFLYLGTPFREFVGFRETLGETDFCTFNLAILVLNP